MSDETKYHLIFFVVILLSAFIFIKKYNAPAPLIGDAGTPMAPSAMSMVQPVSDPYILHKQNEAPPPVVLE